MATETLGQYSNTPQSVKKAADKWIADVSTGLLNQYRFDKEYGVDLQRYMVISAMAEAICADLDCGVDINDCTLEKMNLYISNR